MSVEQIRKRLQNQHGILLTLHRSGAMQRSALSDRLGIRKSSITSIVSDLLSRGVLREENPGALRSPISLDKEKFHVATAFIEPSAVHTADVYFDGSVQNLQVSPLPPKAKPDIVLEKTSTGLAALTSATPVGLVGAGVAIPGLVDPKSETGILAVNFPGWKNIPVGAYLRDSLKLPVSVSHDGRSQLLGNTWFPDSAKANYPKNALYLCLKEGVSCSVMVDGRVLIGNHAAAGEIGCLRAGSEGRLCSCGKRDCLQTYVSLPAIIHSLTNTHPDLGLTSAASIATAASNNPAVLSTLAAILEPLAQKLSTIMGLLDPELLLIGTRDAAFSTLLVPIVQAQLDQELLGLYAKAADVAPALPLLESTLRGVAARVIDHAFSSGEFEL